MAAKKALKNSKKKVLTAVSRKKSISERDKRLSNPRLKKKLKEAGLTMTMRKSITAEQKKCAAKGICNMDTGYQNCPDCVTSCTECVKCTAECITTCTECVRCVSTCIAMA